MSRFRISFLAVLVGVATTGALTAQAYGSNSPPRSRDAAPAPETPEGELCGILFLTHSSSLINEPDLGIACANQSTNAHLENTWWRSYYLPDFGILGPVDICEIQFGVDESFSGGAGQPIDIHVGISIGAPFPDGYRYELGSVSTTLPDMSSAIFSVPVNIHAPAGSEVYIEVHVPDGVPSGFVLFPGANTAPESAPSYISAPACGSPDPVTMESIGFAEVHLIINFRATEVPIAPTGLSPENDPQYVLDVGDSTTTVTQWQSFFPGSVGVTSTMFPLLAPGGLTKGFSDSTSGYGTIAPGAFSDCFTATGDCAVIDVGGTKTLGAHEDLFVGEDLDIPVNAAAGATLDKVWQLHVGGSFADVPSGFLFYPFIENIFHNGVTGGCGGVNYCPANSTLRKQMAVFLLKSALGAGYVPPAATGIFDDVAADAFQPWIEDLYNRGITGGCAGGPPPAPISYCPDAEVKRKQMAVFLLKTLLGSGYVPPAATGIFDDVPADGFQAFIEDLYNRGITGGCAGGPPPAPISYCPENPVTRGQMSAFLVKTFLLQLYGP